MADTSHQPLVAFAGVDHARLTRRQENQDARRSLQSLGFPGVLAHPERAGAPQPAGQDHSSSISVSRTTSSIVVMPS